MKTLTAFYDLKVGPVSFDVVPFLILARMAAEDAGCKRLHIVIVPDPNGVAGMFRDKRNLYDEHEMSWRLWNLIIPSCRLIGASVTLADSWDQARRLAVGAIWPDDWDRQVLARKHYLDAPIIAAAKAGRKVPMMRASEHARRKVGAFFARLGKPVATFTLRKTYEAPRNSDEAAWAAMGEELKARGFAVHVMRDTSEALELGAGYGELNLDLRMASYELAAANLHSHSGCAMLSWFSSAPFIQFDSAMPFKYWAKFWRERGIDPDRGEQIPWARPDQKLVYKAASVEALREAMGWATATS